MGGELEGKQQAQVNGGARKDGVAQGCEGEGRAAGE